ncbi:sugar kinase, partial [Mycobacterium sp. ITM-2017-0098]
MQLSRTSAATSVGDLYALIRDKRELTRGQIGNLTGLSRTAVNARVRELTSRGLVIEDEHAPSTGGRPATLLRIN